MLRHVEPPAQPVAARAEALPFPDATFDLVTCVGALHHVQSPTRALDEMARVVAPGGRVVLQDFVADPDPTRARRWEEIETLRDPGHNRLLAPGEARSRMLAAGLAVDAEESWVHTSELDAWLHVAGCEGDAATRIRALVGGGGELRMQVGRARFRRPRADE
jgi:SAM-dependent methyltransferase